MRRWVACLVAREPDTRGDSPQQGWQLANPTPFSSPVNGLTKGLSVLSHRRINPPHELARLIVLALWRCKTEFLQRGLATRDEEEERCL